MADPAPAPASLSSIGLSMLVPLLSPEDQSSEASYLRSHGPATHDRLERFLQNPSGDQPLIALARELALSRTEMIGVALAARVETDLMCGRAIAHLQAPLGGSRP